MSWDTLFGEVQKSAPGRVKWSHKVHSPLQRQSQGAFTSCSEHLNSLFLGGWFPVCVWFEPVPGLVVWARLTHALDYQPSCWLCNGRVTPAFLRGNYASLSFMFWSASSSQVWLSPGAALAGLVVKLCCVYVFSPQRRQMGFEY